MFLIINYVLKISFFVVFMQIAWHHSDKTRDLNFEKFEFLLKIFRVVLKEVNN